MRGKTHIVGGIAASLAFAHFYHYDPISTLGAGVAGALLPDICHSGSTIGRKLPLLSKLVNKLFGHRTFTHSLLFLVTVAFLLNMYVPNESLRGGFLVGMASHYLLDMATKNGIQLLYPIRFTVRFPLTAKTGGAVETVVFAVLSLFSFYMGYLLFDHYLG
ncbi:metal-dependent hydrolase [Sporosarcina sp. HYO08]|uniref:metal-dependent hydrolase n=1 Tax=Sporosarcina sp. HYO08 TaxID=1759557 RepID=UPI0007977D2D|nr:metal-dependent hydrolase [Sporosarcina sp. HYO08]KXH81925.1 hypothetical protein AU377_06595 [Sporosarcina sp. HYO08]